MLKLNQPLFIHNFKYLFCLEGAGDYVFDTGADYYDPGFRSGFKPQFHKRETKDYTGSGGADYYPE